MDISKCLRREYTRLNLASKVLSPAVAQLKSEKHGLMVRNWATRTCILLGGSLSPSVLLQRLKQGVRCLACCCCYDSGN